MDPAPTIAIVGRPNVGKSTLFNRLIGKRQAITSDIPGTTRDRIAFAWHCNGYQTLLVDTGGLEHDKKENIESDVQAQANLAIKDADLILFVVDGMHELTVDDFTVANILRKSTKPTLIVANKCDNPHLEQNVFNIYELGFGDPIQISAIHKSGIEILEGTIEKELKRLKFKKKSSKKTSKDNLPIAIVGKPNAGKSSLINALLGEDKVIVSEIAGTTRDSVDIEFEYQDQKYTLTDTAGLRRRGKIEKGIEKFSSLRCLNAIGSSEIVVLLIDGEKNISNQDCHIAQMALEQSKGLILAINKIDILEKGESIRDQIIGRLRRKFAFVPWAPVIFVSAKNHKNIFQVLQVAKEISEERRKRIQTAELNAFLQKVTYKHMPASTKMKKPKFFYGSQVDINPPKFTLFFRHPENLHFSYARYLENAIRETYGFTGTAIDLKFKSKGE